MNQLISQYNVAREGEVRENLPMSLPPAIIRHPVMVTAGILPIMARVWPIVPAQAKPISQLSLRNISR